MKISRNMAEVEISIYDKISMHIMPQLPREVKSKASNLSGSNSTLYNY